MRCQCRCLIRHPEWPESQRWGAHGFDRARRPADTQTDYPTDQQDGYVASLLSGVTRPAVTAVLDLHLGVWGRQMRPPTEAIQQPVGSSDEFVAVVASDWI
jgi:hypothetical protein